MRRYRQRSTSKNNSLIFLSSRPIMLHADSSAQRCELAFHFVTCQSYILKTLSFLLPDSSPCDLSTNNNSVVSSTTLSQLPAHVHQPLPQLCHVLYWRLVGSFLHHSPNMVISRTKVRAVGRPYFRSSAFGSLATNQLHCLTCNLPCRPHQ